MLLPWNKHSRRAPKCLIRLAALLCAAFFLPFSSHAALDPTYSRSTEEQSPESVLKFQYRIFPNTEVEKVTAVQDGKPLESRHTPFVNNPLHTSAILVLVDTSVGSSRAPRDHTIEANKEFIKALLANAQPHDLIGVCSFANDLVDIAPVGSDFSEIRNKIAHLKADGLGTRIYRQGMNAIDKLAAIPASRKALLILSDGKDEDNGFTMVDLTKAALNRGVLVFTMGCPETGADVPALGNLEKIAAETRGLYAQAKLGTPGPGERLKADTAFAQAVLGSVNSGGEIVVPLDRVAAGKEVVFEITTKDGKTLRHIHKPSTAASPVVEPSPTPAAAPVVAIPTPTPAPTATPSTPPSTPAHAIAKPTPVVKPAEPNGWLMQKLTPANLISGGTILLLAAAVWILRRRKANTTPVADTPTAYLEMQDAESKRVPLTKIANRIGRRADNDVVFTNTSISGYHAEIHCQRDGTFIISDLGSGNGLVVNEQRVTQANLKNGDLIELGEVRFRFFSC